MYAILLAVPQGNVHLATRVTGRKCTTTLHWLQARTALLTPVAQASWAMTSGNASTNGDPPMSSRSMSTHLSLSLSISTTTRCSRQCSTRITAERWLPATAGTSMVLTVWSRAGESPGPASRKQQQTPCPPQRLARQTASLFTY